ncbi:BrnA antitoxin family protein [Ochrobactrum sp. EDr1-4]|uniref:BrnA antitoxin family protein n=1 Tax=Ochrobactrum sp. EDr1-4 TaxID=3368622 RepID=UPI003B9EED5A
MAIKFRPEHAAEHGYTKQDWDAVDSPSLTEEEIKSLKPAKEILPTAFFAELEKGRTTRGRPRIDKPKEAVTLRLDPDVVARFKANGKNWRANMNDALRKAVGL